MGLLPRRVTREPDVVLSAVSAECEAFLAGALADHYARDGEPPVWTWLNVIAHSDGEALRRLAASDVPGVHPETLRTIGRQCSAALASCRRCSVRSSCRSSSPMSAR